MAKHCSVCGKKLRALNVKLTLADGLVCSDCFRAKFPNIPPEQDIGDIIKSLKNITRSNLDAYAAGINTTLQEIADLHNQFFSTREICSNFAVDDELELIQIIPNTGALLADSTPRVYRFDQIAGYELLENGSSISSGGLGRAAVGGLAFGAAGAIVGSISSKRATTCKNIEVKIILRDAPTPTCYIKLLTSEVKTTSWTYQDALENAHNITAVLQVILESQQQQSTQPEAYSEADELRKFKQLMDDGIITQEEFESKKRQILGL